MRWSCDRDCSVVPFGKRTVSDDAAGFEEVCGDFAAGFEGSVQDGGRHRQPSLRVSAGDQVAHQFHRFKHHALAGASHMREDAMFDGIVLRTVRRVVSHSNLDAQTVGQVLQGFLEDVSVRGVAATRRRKATATWSLLGNDRDLAAPTTARGIHTQTRWCRDWCLGRVDIPPSRKSGKKKDTWR